jgi:hypothetical protein
MEFCRSGRLGIGSDATDAWRASLRSTGKGGQREGDQIRDFWKYAQRNYRAHDERKDCRTND